MRDNKPMPCELAAGTHFLCNCLRTKNPPFCDGSHSGTGKTPCQHVVESDTQRIFWCQCGESGNLPYCDGSHTKAAAS